MHARSKSDTKIWLIAGVLLSFRFSFSSDFSRFLLFGLLRFFFLAGCHEERNVDNKLYKIYIHVNMCEHERDTCYISSIDVRGSVILWDFIKHDFCDERTRKKAEFVVGCQDEIRLTVIVTLAMWFSFPLCFLFFFLSLDSIL